MKRIQYNLFCFLTGLFLQNCTGTAIYDQKAKTLDSLSGAFNAVLINLKNTDTLLLNKAINRYVNYKLFIQNNLRDTIDKSQADVIQLFYKSGTNLNGFKENRGLILKRAVLINVQLKTLSEDVTNRKIQSQELNHYVYEEKMQVEALIEIINQQQKNYFSSIEDFKISLKNVEQVLIEHNKGELPAIIQEEQPF